MHINLVVTAGLSGLLSFVCWLMAARNRREEAADLGKPWKPGVYLRSSNFTTMGNVFRVGYLLFNGVTVLCLAGLLYLNLT